MYDVLFIFSDNLLQQSHVYKNSSWIFTLHIKSSMLDPDLYAVISSAKHNIFKLEQLLISFTYIKNNIRCGAFFIDF